MYRKGRVGPSLAAALLDSLFEQPAMIPSSSPKHAAQQSPHKRMQVS